MRAANPVSCATGNRETSRPHLNDTPTPPKDEAREGIPKDIETTYSPPTSEG